MTLKVIGLLLFVCRNKNWHRFNPHFSPEGGFIATDFEYTGIVLDQWNTDCISGVRNTG